MTTIRSQWRDLLALFMLLLLPMLWFLPVLFPAISGLTLLPYDNLYSFEPWRSQQPNLVPHNNLLLDLVLENAVWKEHIRQTFADGSMGLSGRFPLWNPHILTGLPFFAAGQSSTLYPLNILFYVMPLEAAYGWFTALQIALAGINTYLFCRVLRLRPQAAFFSGMVFMFSGFLIVSVVFTMFVAAVVWLPLLLAIIEQIIRKQETKGNQSFRPVPYIIAGAIVIGLVVLAGHPELIYYTMIVAGLYSLIRLIVAGLGLKSAQGEDGERVGKTEGKTEEGIVADPVEGVPIRQRHWGFRITSLAAWLLGMAVIGIGMGAVQLIPLMELLPYNFREGSATFKQVLDWAWPERHVLTFFLPDIFGNPSHHQWYNIWQNQWVPVTHNSLGEPVDNTFWGIKNYVEGGNYLGMATWLLAAVAVLNTLANLLAPKNQPTQNASTTLISNQQPATSNHTLSTAFFSFLAILSLLFAFGTPLYAILYYGLPGWSQLHSPFRWVFPFTLCMAVLAGIGLEYLLSMGAREGGGQNWGSRTLGLWWRRGLFTLPIITMLGGLAVLGVVCVSLLVPDPFQRLGQRAVDGIDLVQMVFADGTMFWSYQAVNLIRLGLFTLLSGLLLWGLLRRKNHEPQARASSFPLNNLLPFFLIAIVLADLYVAHGRFNPAAPTALSPYRLENQPPVVRFMEEHNQQTTEQSSMGADLWRFTTFDMPGEKTLNANVGMYYGWHDIRGYDSVIPRQYTHFMGRIAPQGELLYNRIAALYSDVSSYEILNNPLLDFLNVRYVFTQHHIPNPEWSQIYRDEHISIYENTEVIDRAFVVPEARIAPPDLQPLVESDLRQVVYIEDMPAEENALLPSRLDVADVSVSTYAANGLFVDLNLSDRGWLVVTDAYFPGWKAYIRPFGEDESQEEELTIYRANGAFRTVYIPETGQWTVRFVYSPLSFKLGLYVSFLAFMTALLLVGWWGWGRYYRPEGTGDVERIAKNSLVPMALNLSNKAIDFAFAMLYVRLLGPEGTGKYYFVVAIYGLFEILSRYGLGTLVMRDVAADKSQASRYLTNVLALRTLLWLVSLPLLALVTYGYTAIGTSPLGDEITRNSGMGLGLMTLRTIQIGAILLGAGILTLLTINRQNSADQRQQANRLRLGIWLGALLLSVLTGGQFIEETGQTVQGIGRQEVQAIALFAVAMLFANWADALSSMFNAFEKMEYPAGLSSVVALIKVALGALVLLIGWGFVGLAGVSLLVNIGQVFFLYGLVRRVLFRPEWTWDWSLQKWMVGTSGPLMINHLLSTIFWRIDIWILRPVAGAASVGLYSVGIKYLDGLNIIPSVFTLAIFPLMSRYARTANGHEADSQKSEQEREQNSDPQSDTTGEESRSNLLRSYVLSTRLLLMISLPIALAVTVLAEPLVALVGGSKFLGMTETVQLYGYEFRYPSGSDLALQVIIWSIPIGFINSVTQYVLIAVNQQRYLTKAFIIGVVFNTVGNLLVIPTFGYLGAAVVTILSEFSLLFPFYYSVRRHVGTVPWLAICIPPVLSILLAGVATLTFTGWGMSAGAALLLGLPLYVGALYGTGAFRGEGMAVVWQALPLGPIRRLLGSQA
ncbi:MAG: oligosaccharide flippase family protein [Chloroflexota bacterium]